MSSPYQPYNPSTGPNRNTSVYPYNRFTPPGPGTAYYANLSPNLTPDPGPPAPQSDNGILLENSLNSFIELEDNSGWLVIE
jgi:hypothetical protein